MKFSNIKELAKQYYPSEQEMERQALREFIYENRALSAVDVSNLLIRGGIDSIEKLHKASIDDIKKLNRVGQMKLSVIIELKEIINKLVET